MFSSKLGLLLIVPLALSPESRGPDAARTFDVVVAAGESLRVTIEGEGEPVVLIPGLVGSAFGYRLIRARLADAGYRAIVIEPLGFGESSRPERANYSLTAQADRVGRAMQQLGLENTIMVAHAMGASIALRLSYRLPGRVRAVVSLDGGPAERAGTPGFRRAMRFVPVVKLFGGVNLVRRKLREQLLSASGDTSWVTDEVIAGYTTGHARNLDGTLKAYLRMADAREPEALGPNLGRILVPVRLLIGQAEHDGGIQGAEIQLFTTRLPNFAVSRIAGAGLFLHEERPDAVLAAVNRLARAEVTSE